jgi:deoxyribodipyrimidine photolyase-like uncharacterized protein
METFYRLMRKRYRVLIDEADKPVGSQWNFDAENRKPWKGDPPEPADLRPQHDHMHAVGHYSSRWRAEFWRTCCQKLPLARQPR